MVYIRFAAKCNKKDAFRSGNAAEDVYKAVSACHSSANRAAPMTPASLPRMQRRMRGCLVV